MKLYLDGKINRYYVQTLCMIFFPGEKFSEDEIEDENTPILHLSLRKEENEAVAELSLSLGDKCVTSEKRVAYTEKMKPDRTEKIVIGAAMTDAGQNLLGYRPSWGMLTGVRPSKVAMEMLRGGMSKTAVKNTLVSEYCVIPKKAALAIDVALKEMKIIGTPSPKDCSVYIAIPFCPTRCAYCSFVSYTSKKLLSLIPEYLVRLAEEVKSTFATAKHLGLNVKTVYVGGGTPTVLTAEQMRFLLSTVGECIDTSTLEEFTFEAGRPDTIDAEKLAVAAQYGVTRVSVNPQSLCAEVLDTVERHHSTDDFFRAYALAKESEVKFVNVDLIAGLPSDNFTNFSRTMDKILELRPDNITVHTFCVKKSAEIIKGGRDVFSLRGGDTGKCVDYSQIKAMHDGYAPYYMYRQKNAVGNYENVGFSLEGAEGLYNIYMMEEVHTILAAGAGAVTKLVDYAMGEDGKAYIQRLFNHKYPYEYLSDNAAMEKEKQIEEFYATHGLI